MMTRHLFDGGELVINSSGAAQAAFPFTVWTERVGGDNVTSDMRAPDGVSVVPVQSDSDGEVPYLRGPDGMKGPLYRDTGTDTRSVWRSAEAERETTATVEDLADAPPTLPAGGTENVDILWRGSTERTGVWAPPPTGGGSGSGVAGAPAVWPSTFPSAPHTHPSSQVSDATSTGRAVMTAADAQAARAAIGAGTGSGTSNLQLGATASTAAPGNHAHAASAVAFTPSGPVTASNVQDAIVQAANSGGGGGGGTSAVLVWRYTAGGWPALPASRPAGVYELRALGPSYPTTIPSWVGLAADRVPMSYSKVDVL